MCIFMTLVAQKGGGGCQSARRPPGYVTALWTHYLYAYKANKMIFYFGLEHCTET